MRRIRGLCQTILTVEDLGIEIAFNAVQTSVYRCIGVALSCDNASVFDADLKTAACTAEAAYAFVQTISPSLL